MNVVEEKTEQFFRDNRQALSLWHPGLSLRVLKNALGELSLEEWEKARGELLQGVPLAYVLGSRFFYKGEFYVNGNVLIPRVESELILELLGKRWRDSYRVLLDVGTGSGCLGLSCAMEFESLQRVILTDISPQALEVARLNREKLSYTIAPHCHIQWEQGDCLDFLPRADVVISNPPYVKKSQSSRVHSQVFAYEPHEALFLEDEEGGYQRWYQTFFARISHALCEGGLFVMEGESDALPALEILLRKFLGVSRAGVERDLTGRRRFLWGEF